MVDTERQSHTKARYPKREYLNQLAKESRLYIAWPLPFKGKIVLSYKGQVVHDYWDDSFSVRCWLEIHLEALKQSGSIDEWVREMLIIRPERQAILLEELDAVDPIRDIEVGLMANLGKDLVIPYA